MRFDWLPRQRALTVAGGRGCSLTPPDMLSISFVLFICSLPGVRDLTWGGQEHGPLSVLCYEALIAAVLSPFAVAHCGVGGVLASFG